MRFSQLYFIISNEFKHENRKVKKIVVSFVDVDLNKWYYNLVRVR